MQRQLDLARRRNLKPPPKLTVSQWADDCRRLSPEASAEIGRWNTARAEYQRGIMDAFSDPLVETVVIMSSAQVGKTEIINNVVGFVIDQDPAPMLVVQPTLAMAQTWSKDRLAPMIRDTPALHGKVKQARSRDSGNTLLHKIFPGGHITMAGANSPASLASRPVRLVLLDEVDRFKASAGAEGDPTSLAFKRSTTFWNRKHAMVSTPGIKGASRIELAFAGSDQRRFFAPCPHCGHEQFLVWGNVHWEKDDYGGHRPETACYACQECGAVWNDADRWRAIRKGHWRATAPFRGVAGFHLNELYSPWVSFARLVESFLEAKRLPDTLKVWVNTALGEPWEERGDGIEDGTLLSRAYDWGETAPAQVLVLTAGVDVQDDRIEIEVVGWGLHEQCWSIDYLIIEGDPAKPEIWQTLDAALVGSYETDDGRRLMIRAACVDTGGHHTQAAYGFCKSRWLRRIWAIKGVAGQGRPVWPPRFSTRNKGRTPLYAVGVDSAKEVIYARLKIEEPGPGYCHFPASRDAEYFRQMAAEKAVTEHKNGFPARKWVKTRGRNEALDCRVYAYAALEGLKASRRLDLARESQRLGPAAETPASVQRPSTAAKGLDSGSSAEPAKPKSASLTRRKITASADPYL
ncbi:phage terminase large subunit family protein [Desulfarculus baarsii]